MSTIAAPEQNAARKPKTRIARFALPQIDANSALLPPDKWILSTAWDFLKNNKSLHKTMGRLAGFAGLGLVALGAGIAGAAMVFPAVLPLVATAVATLALAGFAGVKAKQQVDLFKKETLKELKEHIGKKYLEYKMAELKAAWQRKAEARAKEKAAQKADATNAQQAPPPSTAAALTPAPEAPVTKPEAPAEKNPTEKSAEKPAAGFGSWMLKKAMEKAQKKPAEPPKPEGGTSAAAKTPAPPQP